MEKTSTPDIVACKKDVLSVLYYYDFFYYPLHTKEVNCNCSRKCSIYTVQAVLNDLKKEGKVFSCQQYYGLSHDIKQQVARREQGNRLARQKIKNALFAGKIIYLFPFVRFVGISGSLSKGYAKPGSDFDFFIITDAHRLWICRTLLHLFKKITFVFGQQHKFCMNYFIDVLHLSIEEKNIYTAIELSSLVPVAGRDIFMDLTQSNSWTKEFLPNGYFPFWHIETIFQKHFLWKKLVNKIPDAWAEQLNQWLMVQTDKRWRKKWKRKNFSMKEYDLAFKTTLYHSKNHPANYQKKLLDHIKDSPCKT